MLEYQIRFEFNLPLSQWINSLVKIALMDAKHNKGYWIERTNILYCLCQYVGEWLLQKKTKLPCVHYIKMVPMSIHYETIQICFEPDNQSILCDLLAGFLLLIPTCTAIQSVLKSAYYECPLLHVLCQPLQFWLNLIITSLV